MNGAPASANWIPENRFRPKIKCHTMPSNRRSDKDRGPERPTGAEGSLRDWPFSRQIVSHHAE
jgi:hypothetical protein